MKFLALLLVLLITSSFSNNGNASPPTVIVTSGLDAIHFEDDLDFSELDIAIQRQLDAYQNQVHLSGRIAFGTTTYPASILKDSLILFRDLVAQTKTCLQTSPRPSCMDDFHKKIVQKFKIYRPNTNESKFTAYYSPDFYASATPSARFKLPLYRNPVDSTLIKSTREQIIYGGALTSKGLESVYIDADLFELYSLQIEGGGRIHLLDDHGAETIQYLSFDGANGCKLNFFSKLMVQNGYLDGTDLSYEKQHDYFLTHPEIQRKLFAQSPSYVYFKITSQEPVGIDTIPLTENRSLAFDRKFYPFSGMIHFVKSSSRSGNISRFFIGQDQGSAIKGVARADLYFGFGDRARTAAETLVGHGNQFFLIKR